ncbi:MAG: prolyl oligopeptidase family serine peptidase [Planctomycetes bacterium]|nr:prolyl oligopeptidase family serine peptidase [Planctomycetota bacterium]
MKRFVYAGLILAGFATLTFAEDVPAPKAVPGPGNHTRTLTSGGKERSYIVHVPKKYDPEKPVPVVLALHGAGMDGSMMIWFSGLNQKSEEAGFLVVYPSGTGLGPFRTWNAGGFTGKMAEGRPDDVAFIRQLLDELGGEFRVDPKRVYACGMSNGGMMSYRLAAELSDRIAAIAPVAGTIAIDESRPTRPVPVIHFHGTKDTMVPFTRRVGRKPPFISLKDVDESITTWVKLNGCETEPRTETLSEKDNDLRVTRQTYGQGKEGSEVVLIAIEEGGHTWPGQVPPVDFIGKSVRNVAANDLLWEFFQKHPKP